MAENGKTGSQLGQIERSMIKMLIKRIKMGQEQYGVFEDTDDRDMHDELLQELLDALIYLTFILVKIMRHRDE